MAGRFGGRGVLAVSAALILSALASPVRAGAREEALAVVDKWVAAFVAADVPAITALYAPDALFLGTGSRAVVTQPAGIRDYFAAALPVQRPQAKVISSSVLELSPDAAVVVGLDESFRMADGQRLTSPGRFTFVVARRGDTWLIVHFHRSAVPG
jgi:uncharacterized protein (TIGR02246 family)